MKTVRSEWVGASCQSESLRLCQEDCERQVPPRVQDILQSFRRDEKYNWALLIHPPGQGNRRQFSKEIRWCMWLSFLCACTHVCVVFSKLQCIIPTDKLVYILLKFYKKYLCICIISWTEYQVREQALVFEFSRGTCSDWKRGTTDSLSHT